MGRSQSRRACESGHPRWRPHRQAVAGTVTERLLSGRGLSLPELAENRGLTLERAAALIEPFIEAGIVQVEDDTYIVADVCVLQAFSEGA